MVKAQYISCHVNVEFATCMVYVLDFSLRICTVLHVLPDGEMCAPNVLYVSPLSNLGTSIGLSKSCPVVKNNFPGADPLFVSEAFPFFPFP
jgi:hypothetical protein